MSSVGNYYPATALHSTSSLGRSSTRVTKAWIMVSVIVDQMKDRYGEPERGE
jgi:hypothetical protein